MGSREGAFPTGLRFLDQRLGGGIAPGGMLALTAPASSQVELLFQELAGERRLLYLSLLTDDEAELREIVDPEDELTDQLVVGHWAVNDVLSEPAAFAELVPEASYVVVDAVNQLEQAPHDRYLAVLNELKAAVRRTDSLVVLNCIDADPTPNHRSLTLKRADHVWNVRVSIERSEITTELLITKSRENQILPEPLPLDLSEEVRIDTSRTIA